MGHYKSILVRSLTCRIHMQRHWQRFDDVS